MSPNKSIALKTVSSSRTVPEDWTLDHDTRVLMKTFDPSMLVDANKLPDVLAQLSVALEIKDVAVVTEGLVELKAPKSGTEFVEMCMPDKPLCLVCFESSVQNGQVVTVETTKRISMTGSDYCMYLKQRKDLLSRTGSIAAAITSQDDHAQFELLSEKRSIHVGKIALYFTDFELGDNASLLGQLELRGPMKYMLPSKEWCMTESASVIAIIFASIFVLLCSLFPLQLTNTEKVSYGPHVFVAPTTSFTSFHQDCYGTVDSVHHCHSGCNEIVMLPRLNQAKKLEALDILFEHV